MNEKRLEDYIGEEMLIDEMVDIFIDKWVIAEVTGETPRFRSIGKAICFFDTEKEMHLGIRRMRSNGDKRPISSFRGKYGPDTPKPRYERVRDYEEY